MQKRLFLTGPSGVGKTWILRQQLKEQLASAGGFVTERIADRKGAVLGFELLPAAAAAGIEGFSGQRFLDCSVSPPRSDNEVFRSFGVQLLEEAAYYPFAVLDEIGGYELLIPQFRNALAELLNSDTPCIGVLKSPANARQLKRRFGFGSKFTAHTRQLHRALKADPDTLIIKVNKPGDKRAMDAVERWVREFCN